MAREAKGELRTTSEGHAVRVTIRGKQRKTFPLPTCRTEDQAQERADIVAKMAQSFRRAGVLETDDAIKLLEMAAAAQPALLPGVRSVADDLAGGTLPDKATAIKAPTFKDIADEWTSGKLHKRFPDHVRAKDSDLDEARLKTLSELDVGGIKLGAVPLDHFTIDHADAAMRQLPERVRRSATRRQYAQLIHRVLALAVYPCRVMKASPLPRGWLPKPGKPPAFPYLHPSDDAKLLACKDVALTRRILWGFLDREGPREGEAFGLRVKDFDLRVGSVSLDENKTDDPRTWALREDVTRALRAWVKMRGAKPADYMFVDEFGEPFNTTDHGAEQLRLDLKRAGIDEDRPELFERGKNRGRIRAHDLRATFVTLSLANGASETFVADRTGHRSSAMINRYRRAARSAKELGLGRLGPLDGLIPELSLPLDCPTAPIAGQTKDQQVHRIPPKAEVAELADAADSKSVAQ